MGICKATWVSVIILHSKNKLEDKGKLYFPQPAHIVTGKISRTYNSMSVFSHQCHCWSQMLVLKLTVIPQVPVSTTAHAWGVKDTGDWQATTGEEDVRMWKRLNCTWKNFFHTSDQLSLPFFSFSVDQRKKKKKSISFDPNDIDTYKLWRNKIL